METRYPTALGFARLRGYDGRVPRRSKASSDDAMPGLFGREGAQPAPPTRPAAAGDARSDAASTPDRRLTWLDRMRPFRERREREVSIDGALRALERQLRDEHSTLGDLIDAWNAVVPAPLQGIARIVGVAQGTLTVAVATSGASYELSRALRAGLERRLLEKLPPRVKRIKVKVVGEA
jgi:hypothetical protein